jgi:uncharacterized membrane protein YidH (DUF202 family)
MISEQDLEQKPIKHIINEMQLLLSEKRTSLSILRTGITVMLFPMSVLTVLLATSRYFDINRQLKFAVPLGIICLGFLILGLYLIIKAARQIKKCDHAASMLLRHSEYLRDLLDFRD